MVFLKSIRNKKGELDIQFIQLENVDEIINCIRNYQMSHFYNIYVTIYVGLIYYEIYYNDDIQCDLVKINNQ